MKKEFIQITIPIHYIQARIIKGLRLGTIDLSSDTLRGIAEKIDVKELPQSIKHHLEALCRIGIIQKMYGEYKYVGEKQLKK